MTTVPKVPKPNIVKNIPGMSNPTNPSEVNANKRRPMNRSMVEITAIMNVPKLTGFLDFPPIRFLNLFLLFISDVLGYSRLSQ